MDEKDSMTPDTIPQSTPVDGTVSAGRKNRRPVVIGVAAVAAVALVAGGVCGYRAWEDHRVSVARGACGSAVAAQKKAVDSYRTLLASDDTANALKTDVKDVKDPRSVTVLRKKATMRMPGMVSCDASSVDGLDAARKKADGNAKRVDKASKSWGTWSGRSNRRNWTRLWRTRTGCTRRRKARSRTTRPAQVYWTPSKTRRGRHCEGREGGQRFEDGEGEGRCRAAAKAQAEQEAAAQAAAAQQAQQQAQAQRSYSYGSYSSGGWSGSAGGQSYSGGSQGQGGGSPSVNSPAPSIHYDWEDKVTINPNCDGQHFCPLG